jgi:hypothetical protein
MTQTKTWPMDDRWLDRLVDGELSAEEYAAVMRSLDDAPDGWRRCALAFLEAQAWQRDLGAMRGEAPSPTASVVVVRPATAAKRWPLLLAVAASFVLAFGLGIAMRPLTPTMSPAPVGGQLAENSVRPTLPGEGADAAPSPNGFLAPASALPSGNVTFVMDHGDGSGSREVPVPVYDWSPENEQWLSGQPMAPSSELQRAVQRFGHRVRTHKHFIPVETGDGRHVLFPVDQMEITPAGRRMYQ